MDYKNTDEYRVVKQLTASENRKALKKAAIQLAISGAILYTSYWGFIYGFLWIMKQ